MHFDRAGSEAISLRASVLAEAGAARRVDDGRAPNLDARERERLVRRWLTDYAEFVGAVLKNAGTPASEIDDAVQRTFIIVARRYADVRPGSERGFLLKIALNVAAHARRSAARRREVVTPEPPEPIDDITPEQLTSSKRRQRQLAKLLDRLVPELRTVLVMYELEQLTMAEIAETLRIPAGTVASRLRRARTALRDRLRDRHPRVLLLAAGPLAFVKRAHAVVSAGTAALGSTPGLVVATAIAAGAILPQLGRKPDAAPATLHREAAAQLARLSPAPPETGTDAGPTPPAAEPAGAESSSSEPAAERKVAPAGSKRKTSDALQRELSQLDRARAQLSAGSPAGALALLNEYSRAEPRGALRLEAEVLRIDALLQSGREDQARARARAFLNRHPTSVLSARVRRLAGD